MVAHVFGTSRRLINLSISTTVANRNIYTLAGSPTTAVDVVLTITPPGIVRSTTGAPALITSTSGQFPAGSTIKIIVQGTIDGPGGGGGLRGGTNRNGADGGDAIGINDDNVSIDTGVGTVRAGGGGGGAGGYKNTGGLGSCGGGGGGGGQGRNGGGGGLDNPSPSPETDGTNGGDGDENSGGSFGLGGTDSFYGTAGGRGGRGGSFGSPGEAGKPGTPGGQAGGSGGNPGYAVRLNGHTVTWIAGNDSTHVKGAVA